MTPHTPGSGEPEHVDVLIVGAGLSGIGIAHYLTTLRPATTFAILEARDDLGGTWDLFGYPGIRSDSDLFTYGFAFKPWRGERTLADGPAILAYLREAAADDGTTGRIRYRRRVVAASWSGGTARWTVDVEHATTGAREQITCGWLVLAAGYYRYDHGYTPRFDGVESFGGRIVHPQHWPVDLDVTGKRVVVIGSGATAVTLVPALAASAAHVTMLQRTPTYVLPVPGRDRTAELLRHWVGQDRAHAWVRRRNIARQHLFWEFCRRYPSTARRLIRRVVAARLPAGYPVDVHFAPPYDPWDQRLCVVPDGDLFTALSAGTASVVTGRIECFTPEGVRLASGEVVPADVIVTATGLQLQALGGVRLTVDGVDVRLADTVAYKGVLLSGVPNLAYAIGYVNASWTLRIDLVGPYLCRLMAHMQERGFDTCRPEPVGPPMRMRPALDLAAGYVQRAADELPRQGDRPPWQSSMSRRADVRLLGGEVADPELRLDRSAGRPGVDPSSVVVGGEVTGQQG